MFSGNIQRLIPAQKLELNPTASFEGPPVRGTYNQAPKQKVWVTLSTGRIKADFL